MASKIDIINLALTHLAEQPINALDEGSESANIMSRLYDISLDSEIRDFAYTWATRTAELALIEDEEALDFRYVYQLPADYLMIDRIVDARTGASLYTYSEAGAYLRPMYQEWEIREGKLYINNSAVCLEYRALEEDTTKWDASFVMAFSYKLAELAGPAITEKESFVQRAAQYYVRHVNKARSSNGSERQRSPRMSMDYLNARNT